MCAFSDIILLNTGQNTVLLISLSIYVFVCLFVSFPIEFFFAQTHNTFDLLCVEKH